MPGGSRRLDITLHYDTTQADQQSAASTATRKRHTQELLTAQQAAEKAAEALIAKENKARVDAALRDQSVQEQRITKILTKEEIAAQIRMRLIDRLNQQNLEAAMKEQGVEDRKIAAILTKEEVAEKAKEALINRLNAKRVEAATAEMKATDRTHRIAMQALDERIGKFKEQDASITGGIAAVGKFGASLLGLAGAQQIVTTLADVFSSIHMSALKSAEDVMRLRDGVRELQALRDEMGQTGPGIAHVFDIARQTLQTPGDVQAMESAGLGIGELALKNDADRKEFEKAMVAAGRFQVMEGGSASAYGQMMGQIALQGKGPLNAEDMEARAWRLFQIQQPGGFTTMSQAMGQYGQLNGLVQNGIYTPEEAMGLASAFSVASPESAATRTEQFTRAVMAGRIKARGMQVSSDVDLLKTDEYFKELKIAANDSALVRGRKIAADLAKQRTTQGKDFNAYEYLMTRGFGNAEDREAIMALSGLVNNDRFSKIEKAMNGNLERGAITSRFNDRLRKDNFLKGRAVELSEQAASAKEGLKEEPLVLAQRAAFARLKARGAISGTFEEWQAIERGGLGSKVQAGVQDMFYGGYHSQVTREMMRSLESERKRLGIKAPGVWASGSAHEYELQYARKVQEAGGDVTRGVTDDLARVAKNLADVTGELKKQVEGNPVKAPIPARPPNLPVRVP